MSNVSELIELFQPAANLDFDYEKNASLTLPCIKLGFDHLYGGLVFSQALFAANEWLRAQQSTLIPHMSHGVFLKAGNAVDPVTYKITPLGFGRTFQRLEIRAYQNQRFVFQSVVSAQYPETPFIKHEQQPVAYPVPDDCLSDVTLKQKITGKAPPQFDERPIEVRVATPDAFLKKQTPEARQALWFRYKQNEKQQAQAPSNVSYGHEISASQKQSMLAYASDYGFLGGLFMAHDPRLRLSPYFLTSLDHSLWYYQKYQPDQWALFETESPVAQAGRGAVIGRIYQNSALVALAAQEGLIRRRE